MDVARCTADGITYTAPRFEALGEACVQVYRQLLVCPECGARAFFRKESTSGQAACFGARPHATGCSMAAAEPRYRGGAGLTQDERINHGERIEIDFAYGAHEVVHVDPEEPGDPSGRGGQFRGGNGRRTAVMHRRLSTLLRNLMFSDQFRTSDQLIALREGQFRVKDFFVAFGQVAAHLVGEYRGYWGMLSDARFGRNGEIWLNSGGQQNVSTVVNVELLPEFNRRFRLEEPEDLAGAYALVFGTLGKSSNGKLYLACNDLRYITVSLAD